MNETTIQPDSDDENSVNLWFTCPGFGQPVIQENAHYNSDTDQYVCPKRKRPKRDRETVEYLAAARRFIRGAGKRVAESGDEIELGELIALIESTGQNVITEAVDGMRARGLSWAYIAKATGTTRENAWKRWGKGR